MATVIIDVQRCKGCGICFTVCPRKLLKQSDRIDDRGVHVADATDVHACSGCLQCVLVCPDTAITIVEAARPTPPAGAA